MLEEDIKKLLKENLELNEKIFKNTKYIKRYVIVSQVFGVLKILLVVIPIVLGIIYLPPLFKDIYNKYQELLNIKESVINPTEDINLDKLPPNIRNLLQK